MNNLNFKFFFCVSSDFLKNLHFKYIVRYEILVKGRGKLN